MDYGMILGQRRGARTKQWLADSLEVTEGLVRRWEANTSFPTSKMLPQLFRVLEFSAEERRLFVARRLEISPDDLAELLGLLDPEDVDPAGTALASEAAA